MGKTEILLRENGRNVFIAECKFWKGPKHYYETIDQLIGYSSCRDTKTAILVFMPAPAVCARRLVRNFNKVLQSSADALIMIPLK